MDMRRSLARFSPRSAVLNVLAAVLGLMVLGSQPAPAQTFKVIYNFVGQQDGGHPYGNVAIDRAGNLYGSGYAYGADGFGTVYRLTPKNSSWLFAPLYAFKGGFDGAYPGNGITLGPDGVLYGATNYGGLGCGTVFSLRPPPAIPPTPLSPWNEKVLYRFVDDNYGCQASSTVIFDPAGNMYGVTQYHGPSGGGTVYELTPSGSGWMEKTLHNFGAGEAGQPNGTLVFDSAGNLYGNAPFGGTGGRGWIFQLTSSGSGWDLNVLTDFPQSADGYRPYAGVALDSSGNVYGTTYAGGSGNGGTVFMLTPGAWTFSLLYSFTGFYGPAASLTVDAAGNLYGTTVGDGAYQQGNVFKLTPSGNSWIYTDLHDFTGGLDGGFPSGTLVLDANGNIYGTANVGGSGSNCEFGCGVIFEITAGGALN